MESNRIASLLALYLPQGGLNVVQLEQVAKYLDLLLMWNAKTNLTAIRTPEGIIQRHFGESFFTAAHLSDQDGASLPTGAIDVGSGAGFPGLPLAIYSSHMNVTLVESQSKKATFLKEVVRSLGLKNVCVFAGRVEDLHAPARLVTMRAVEKFAGALPVAVSLVLPGGKLALLIGQAQAEAARQLCSGFTWEEPLTLPGGDARVLLVGMRP